MFSEERTVKRHHGHYFEALDRETGKALGRLVDISPHGIRLLSDDPIRTKAFYNLRVNLPIAVSRAEQLDIEAYSLWCEECPDPELPEHYNTGLELLNVSDESLEAITTLINDYEPQRSTLPEW